MSLPRILVVCMGNICRSPLGARLLTRSLGAAVSSAGLQALVGHPIDALTADVAASQGVLLEGHAARQYTPQMGLEHDLILVMEPAYRHAIAAEEPALLGRTLLFDQWCGANGIPDPYGRSRAFQEQVFRQIIAANDAWSCRLSAKW